MLQNVPHQIIQSLVRLGLPNPNSPSLQTPAPPKFSSQIQQPSQQPPNLHPNLLTTPTSLTLLPLLPPLSRAQSILLRMASLTSRLFEVSPNRTQWLSTFRGSFPTFLSTQTLSLDSSPAASKEIISLFTTLQSQLYEAVTELQEILDLQDAKQKVTREIRSKDSAILAFTNKLKEAERVLDILVDNYSDYRRLKRSKVEDGEESSSTTTVATQLNLSDILSYAHRISYTTFAPPVFGAGTALSEVLSHLPHRRSKCVLLSYIVLLILMLGYRNRLRARRNLPLSHWLKIYRKLIPLLIWQSRTCFLQISWYRQDGSLGCLCSCCYSRDNLYCKLRSKLIMEERNMIKKKR